MNFRSALFASTAWGALSVGFAREAFQRAIIVSGRALGLIKYRRS